MPKFELVRVTPFICISCGINGTVLFIVEFSIV